MTETKYKIRIGITMGDPSGIGPEIIVKALFELRGLAKFVVIGDRKVFEKAASITKHSKVKSHKSKVAPRGIGYQPWGMSFIDLDNVRDKGFVFGKVSGDYGRASMEYLDRAMALLGDKNIDCLVTAPISKEAINLAGFDYCGHTEYLAQKTNTKEPAMMLLNEKLRFVLLTQHIPLKEVALKLNQEKFCRIVLLTYFALKKLFRIKKPRLVVCGLNPHASDNGVIGNEENAIIKPAIERIKATIKDIDGPYGADVAVLRAMQKKYDCIIAAYHDQALISLKLSDPYRGLNLTLGLPFVRTSPLHGTAFDIAGKNKADPTSLIEAIKLALTCKLHSKKS